VKVGVPSEAASGERRVALVPDMAGRLVGAGVDVLVESGAGRDASHLDEQYEAAGARVVDGDTLYAEADVVVRVGKPSSDEVERLRPGTILVGLLQPLTSPEVVRALAERGVTAFSMDTIPRITRAQSMDALSSQATVAGYKAAVVAAGELGKFFPMLTTAAGTIPPGRVLILGAGVAGLQAIATARRLGAIVSAFDVRPVVKEQVESLGATFVELDVAGEETAGGYAGELSADQHERELQLLAEHIAASDAVITTALIPGRPAPLLVTEEAVRAMRPGSVIVDLAAEMGGNCALTEPAATVERYGVTIVGDSNLAATMPVHASAMYARNVWAFLDHLIAEGAIALDFDDEITRETCVTHDGRVLKEQVPA
jgi:NAD(P) transhydrogenase subunit alpha